MKKISILLSVFGAIAIASASFQYSPVNARPVYLTEDSEVAVSGYDVVSYFEGNGTPVEGNKQFTVRHDGADYQFVTAENAEKFKADPAAFAPQYGGHCAWAMARGSLAPGDATVYKIVDGKLYLNFNKQVQEQWLADIPGFITKAEAAWAKVPDDAVFGE